MNSNGDTRTRIAFHSENGPGIGGSDFYMGKLISGLDLRAYDPYLFVRRNYPLDQIIRDSRDVTVVHTDACINCESARPDLGKRSGRTFGFRAKAKSCASLMWQLAPQCLRLRRGLLREVNRFSKQFRNNGIEVFHAMDGGPLASAVAAADAGCRVIVGYNSPPPARPSRGINRVFGRKCYQAANVCVAKSHYTADAWSRHLAVDGRKFTVIANGDDFPEISEDEKSLVRSKLGIASSAPIIGMTGRLDPEKGGKILLEAIPIVLHQFPDLHVIFVGEGTQKYTLKQNALNAGLGPSVHFLGFQPDAWRIVAAYDIAIVPSIFDEPFGWVVIEAMAQGVPVVASRVGGIPEIVDSGNNGLLFSRGDVRELASAIVELLSNVEKQRALGEAGRRKYLSHYRRSQMLDPTLALYASE